MTDSVLLTATPASTAGIGIGGRTKWLELLKKTVAQSEKGLNRRQAFLLATKGGLIVAIPVGALWALLSGQYYPMSGLLIADVMLLIVIAFIAPRTRKWATAKH